MPSPLDISGCEYGFVTVLGRVKSTGHNNSVWQCRCRCGTVRTFYKQQLTKYPNVNCGCQTARLLSERHRKHGKSKSLVYKAWAAMKDRCFNPANTHYYAYGGRGISVCDRWRDSFDSFLADMGDRPDGFTIERIDTNGDYEPGNCRWASRKEQQNNRRCNVRLEIDGVTKTISEWSEYSGVHRSVVVSRIRRGWTARDAVFTVPDVRFRNHRVRKAA